MLQILQGGDTGVKQTVNHESVRKQGCEDRKRPEDEALISEDEQAHCKEASFQYLKKLWIKDVGRQSCGHEEVYHRDGGLDF